MAFGGRVLAGPKRQYEYGTGEFACVYYDPHARQWRRAPRPPGFRSPAIRHERPRRDGADSAAERVYPGTDTVGFKYEVPFSAADSLGRGHVFSGLRSQYIDPATNTWGQPEGPVRHSYPWDPTRNWVDGTTPSWGNRSLGTAATGPDGRMYLVGGLGHPWNEPKSVRDLLAGLDIYDPVSNEWHRGPDMKIARQSLAGAFGHDGKLYIFGGCSCTSSGGQPDAVAATEVYDPKTNTWSEAAPMPEPRMLHAAATGADGRIYMIGGKTRWGGEQSSRVDVYDPVTDAWSRGPSLRFGRTGHTASTTGDGTIWVVGGYTPATGIPTVEELLGGRFGDGTDSVELLKTKSRK